MRSLFFKNTFFLWIFLLLANQGLCLTADESLKDPRLEERARVLFQEIRCVVCQSQSIGESESSLAKDLRMIVREQVAQGRSDAQIKSDLVEKYGDFILFTPPFMASTLLLWAGPFVVLVIGIGIALARQRR